MRQWAHRTTAIRDELSAVADVRDPRWWLLAGAAAVDWGAGAGYVLSDAEPASDTFIGHVAPSPVDVVADAIARAHAARQAIRELDGELPEQPLAVTIELAGLGARVVPRSLDTVAFALGARCWIVQLHNSIDEEGQLAAELATALAGGVQPNAARLRPLESVAVAPLVCVTIGDEPAPTARHGHRRAWTERGGPWLGLSRTDGMAIVSTCHLAVDGYGHARLAARIAALTAELVARVPRASSGPTSLASAHTGRAPLPAPSLASSRAGALPSPAPVRDGVALDYTWREVPTGMRALRLAYALGIVLHRHAGDRAASFSPTFQIPVAPGAVDDPARMRKRVLPAIASVRFEGGVAEPFAEFAGRTKETIAREASGRGVASRLYASLQAVPAPLAWKRRAMAARRAGWMDRFAAVIGGRGCVSRMILDVPAPPSCAVSSPARLATSTDPLGGCVVTIVDDGSRAAVTLCGSGEVARADMLDEILASV